MNKVEIFKETIKDAKALEIKDMIWIKSKNCETWLIRRTNYSRSLAVMSMVGYILGLGDRHPSNLMMSRKTGKIIHIDFGDCFEVAMKRDKFPEKVPFRLTKMLVKALEASGVGGTFKIISEKIMELLRNNKDSLLAILGSFLYDPLISFKLMIPMIIKQKRLEDKSHKKKKNKINDNDYKENGDNYDDSKYMKNTSSTSLRLKRTHILNLINFHNNNVDNNDINEENDLINSPKKKDKVGKIGIINDDKEKNEKKMMENDERHIFNLYEENDEIDSDELNRIAKIVLQRIEHKLSGTDFSPEIIFDIKRQVERLINEAVSYENLAQSYLGWCPFW
jgi:FKBP12-rapamycin complex-associated protein